MYIYFDEKKMWHQAGFKESLVSPAKRDGGDSKNEIGFDVHHIYEHVVVHFLVSTYRS